MDKEQRYFSGAVRLKNEDVNHIAGYCARFNEDSENIGFIETIAEGAITQDTINESDVFCLFNHDFNKVLGRSNKGIGNLTLTVDNEGVRYDCELLDNEDAKTVRSYIQRGLVTQSSFAFTVAEDEDAQTWYRDGAGNVRRIIKKINKLYDASPVWVPAYPTTTVKCRGLEDFLAEEKQKEINDYKEKITALNDDFCLS